VLRESGLAIGGDTDATDTPARQDVNTLPEDGLDADGNPLKAAE